MRDDTVFLENVVARTTESAINLDGAIEDYLGHPRFNVKAQSDRASLSELGRIIPSLARDLTPSFDVAAEGPLEQLAVVGQCAEWRCLGEEPGRRRCQRSRAID